MANDSGLFLAAARTSVDMVFNGWSYEGETEYLPLYEAKMLGHFDHRFSTYHDATQAQLNIGSLPRTYRSSSTTIRAMEPLARYWVARPKVTEALAGKWDREWLLGWRDITGMRRCERSCRLCCPLAQLATHFCSPSQKTPHHGPLLHAVWSTMVFDYVARQKISGTHMNVLHRQADRLPNPGRLRPCDQLAVRSHRRRMGHPVRTGTVVHVVAASALRPGDG